jgi:hypothetical protein
MLRVTTRTTGPGAPLLEVEGKLRDEWVAVLERACATALESHGRVVLDLTHLRGVGPDGVSMLRGLPPRVELINCTLLLQELLGSEANDR